jgi:2-oxoglutarate ferredoxin oxidoreductase subunit alpha
VAYGTSHWGLVESRDQLRQEAGIETSYYRVRGYPFSASLGEFIDRHQRVYVVEQNRDAQMLGLIKLDLSPERVAKLRSVLHFNGLPLDARSITDEVLGQEGHELARPHTLSTQSWGLAGRGE